MSEKPEESAVPEDGEICRPLARICVFCGSRGAENPVFAESARLTGSLIARQGRTLVYGGGHVGLMGVVADAALAEGGKVIGVIPESLETRELGHQGLTELHVVESMHQRKAMMAELSDAFIALGGGLGTYEEIFETATWSLLGIQDKPLGFLNTDGFYDPIIQQLDRAMKEGFLLQEERELVLVDEDPARLIHQLERYCRPGQPKWLNLTQS